MGRNRWSGIGTLGNDLRTEAGGGRDDSVVADEVESRRRHQRREPRYEIEGLEGDVGGSIPPSVLESVGSGLDTDP